MARRLSWRRWGGVLMLAVACRSDPANEPSDLPNEADLALGQLRTFEQNERAARRFESAPTAAEVLGADPYAVVALPGDRFAGILRGDDAIVLLDAELREIARAPTPEGPTGLCAGKDGELFVVGELSRSVARYTAHDGELVETQRRALDGVKVARDVAWVPPDVLLVVDERSDRLWSFDPRMLREPASAPSLAGTSQPTDGGPFRIVVGDGLVGILSLFDHSFALHAVDAAGVAAAPLARVAHDGPIWGATFARAPDGIWIATGGVEDHPLDRTDGAFGYIDSFVEVSRVAAPGAAVERRATVNVSELGVITPKVIALDVGDDRFGVRVLGYGGPEEATLTWSPRPAAGADAPSVARRSMPPGVAAGVFLADGRAVFANTLLDAWILDAAPGSPSSAAPEPRVVAAASSETPPRPVESRLGEALFFTYLMAPRNKTEGRLSRFTCETCHFEGYVDGRTHHTGRGDTRATTKPLLSLLSNGPHFTRALDPDLAAVAHNEFRVAGKGSETDPWFSLSLADARWLSSIGVADDTDLSPLGLRRSLMRFLMDFTHRPNPAAVGRAAWTDEERKGATLFAASCESCHVARLVADDPGTRVPFERWESLVMSRPGPIVWAREGYEKTGIVPYVHIDGARPSSLRRLYKKRPYFTDGSAKSLSEVLDRARLDGDTFLHEGERGAPLSADDRAALLAFLELL